jgi:alpha-1,2-mannosyltransferase
MTTKPSMASWVTSRRIRVHGLLLLACLWSLYAWDISAPGLRDRNGLLKGTDFLHFYALGSLALAHRGADLYNMQVQAVLIRQRVPAAAGIDYLPLYPPQVSIFFAPLSRLSYAWALALWLAISGTIYALCCFALWRSCPNLRRYAGTTFILTAAYPAFFHLIAWGQTSALALACVTLGYFALKNEREFLTGIALGCLIFKPQLGIAAAAIFLSTRAWRVIAGAMVSAFAQLALAWFYYGPAPLREWVRMLSHVSEALPLFEPKLYQTHSLRTFWLMLLPWPRMALALYVFSAVLVLALTIACWRKKRSFAVRYSSLLFATVLVSPHLTVYDLVILAPAFFLLSDGIAQAPNASTLSPLKALLYLTYAFPLLGPSALWTHVQLSVIAMTAMLFVLWKLPPQSAQGEYSESAGDARVPRSVAETR